jgi:hypothetical protein
VGVLNMLVTSTTVGTVASLRTGAGLAGLAVRRTPVLVALGARATVGTGAGAARAQAEFRDEMLGLLDDAAEIAWLQARRARDQLGLRTSPPQPGHAATAQGAAHNGNPPRRHRVKA